MRTPPLASITGVLLCLAMPASAQLLVGNNFGQPGANVLSVDPVTLNVNGFFGDARDFDPAAGSMAQDSLGRVYILDPNRDQIVRFDAIGNVSDVFADSDFCVNGLYYGIGIDTAGNVYVSSDGPLAFDEIDDEIVRFDSSGNLLGTFGEASFGMSGFRSGDAIAFDSIGNLYTFVTDGVTRGRLVRYAEDGTFLGTFGEDNPDLLNANALAFSADGSLFVRSDLTVFKYDGVGMLLGTFVSLSSDGSIALDADGNLFATERLHDRLKKFNSDGALVRTRGIEGPGNLLVIIPEPNTLVLVGIGGVLVLLTPRRRGWKSS